MCEAIASCLLLAIVALLIRRAAIQQRLLSWARPSVAPPFDAPFVHILVPARDEAANIQGCVEGLLNQNYPKDRLRVTVIDDDSADATADIVLGIARRNPALDLIEAAPLAAGWTGKCQACWTGARTARDAEWLCFVDADMKPESALIATALDVAARTGASLVSLAARQTLRTFAERLMIPCALYVLAFRQDLRKLQSADTGRVTVSGQFMLVRRQPYFAVGGHEAVRQEICEDLALAARLKRAGHEVVLADGAGVISTRMYDGWGPLWLGGRRTLERMMGGAGPTLVMAMAALVLPAALVILPLADVIFGLEGDPWSWVGLPPALLALTAVVGLHLAGARHFRIPLWYALLFPLGYGLGAALAIDCLGRGRVRWKGRTYA
ncbi:MAG: glycosyltransferase [Caulobacteraceae bacterium]